MGSRSGLCFPVGSSAFFLGYTPGCQQACHRRSAGVGGVPVSFRTVGVTREASGRLTKPSIERVEERDRRGQGETIKARWVFIHGKRNDGGGFVNDERQCGRAISDRCITVGAPIVVLHAAFRVYEEAGVIDVSACVVRRIYAG